ncbi:hypothetical protein [Sapientia aquatica]|uniref:Uncharacterized protein n=1 Tax=Sapientia aquatica TaxID=1549640 RepID=A0A4V3AU23_9BURK|nr:hypothetical protein [Sapientia aquatica]TDK62707.1 hypothetical protein E2I14_15480 [Sapientia aquatica]
MNRVLIILFLLLISMNVFAQEKMATWEFYNEDYKERGGRYTGPGIAYLDLINCSVKLELLSNEYIIYTYQRSGGLMLIHAVGKKPRDYTLNLGLGCYTGVDLADIKKEFTRPDGSYGMSEMHRQWGEENEVKVGVKLFNGATWQGVGNVQDITTGEYPARYIFVCLFSTATKLPQALCYDRLGLPFKPKTKADTFKYVTDIFERITFIDHDQLPPDSPAIPPKPVEPSPAVPADSVQSE